ncbi:MAG: hypothetical protein PHT07_10190 [Paludibacter sp.]|nr:hypothetical protein [Paludibacter sp.]
MEDNSMLLDFITRRIPVSLEIVKEDLEHDGLPDEVDPQKHFELLRDIQNNILDGYMDYEDYAAVGILSDMDMRYNGDNGLTLMDLIAMHADKLEKTEHTKRVQELRGDGTPGSDLMSEYLGSLYLCYPIDVYMVDKITGSRTPLKKTY